MKIGSYWGFVILKVMKRHNKLVRDKIPEICEAHGDTPHARIVEDEAEYLRLLCDKLIEEAKEVCEAPSLEELADTLEVIHTIGKTLGYEPGQIEVARAKKAKNRGGFDKRIFLISTE
jgi:predicted house-cleaning noncanonical NTP pyrophosphatase (MazG superfamily)